MQKLIFSCQNSCYGYLIICTEGYSAGKNDFFSQKVVFFASNIGLFHPFRVNYPLCVQSLSVPYYTLCLNSVAKNEMKMVATFNENRSRLRQNSLDQCALHSKTQRKREPSLPVIRDGSLASKSGRKSWFHGSKQNKMKAKQFQSKLLLFEPNDWTKASGEWSATPCLLLCVAFVGQMA